MVFGGGAAGVDLCDSPPSEPADDSKLWIFPLQETGVGKTVNSFRKHEAAGEVAKGLVAKWKKLVPQSADRYERHTCASTCWQ